MYGEEKTRMSKNVDNVASMIQATPSQRRASSGDSNPAGRLSGVSVQTPEMTTPGYEDSSVLVSQLVCLLIQQWHHRGVLRLVHLVACR